jgi:hypothetical protein
MPVLMPKRFASMDGATTHPLGLLYAATTMGLPPEQGIGLLLNGGEAGIQINMHD